MQSTVQQGNDGLFILDTTPDPVEDGLTEVDAGLFYIDQDTGIGYTRQAIEGDAEEDGTWVPTGKVVPFVGDQSPPAAPTGLTVTPVTVTQADGSIVPGFNVTWDANVEDDLIGYTLQYGDSPATWAQPVVKSIGLDTAIVITASIIAGTEYDFRLAARDAEGFQSSWSSTVTGTASPDGTAPSVPTGLTATPGYRLMGLIWDRNTERDLAFYQVRYYETAAGSTEAVYIRTMSNHIIFKDLLPDVEYTAEVRAIDRSGNVATSAADLTGLDFEAATESGWSDAATATPTLIGAEDLAVDTVIANFISSGVLSADVIEGGTLSLGGFDAGTIEVYDSGSVLIATLGPDGLVMFNPVNPLEAMWLKAGSLKFTQAWNTDVDTTEWTTAITPEGINASAITFGTGQGGANSVPNAGFELAAFAQILTNVWPDDTAWTSGVSSTVNLATGGGTLTITSI